jgi:hypothetical protein
MRSVLIPAMTSLTLMGTTSSATEAPEAPTGVEASAPVATAPESAPAPETAPAPEARLAAPTKPGKPRDWCGTPPPTAPAPHGADPQPRARWGGARWDTWGHARLRFETMNDPVLDTSGTTSGRGQWASSRLIAGANVKPTETLAFDVEIEALSGAFAGQTTSLGTAADAKPFRVRRDGPADLTLVLPRALAITATFPKAGQLRAGIQSFSWGTGMLANDGKGDTVFGDPDQGNVNARVLFATQPFKNTAGAPAMQQGLSFFAAADLVVRDDNAFLYEGDLAVAGLFGLRATSPRGEVGALFVGRWQRDHADPLRPTPATTTAFPVDVYGKVRVTPNEGEHHVTLEGEAAVVQGRSTRPWFEATVPEGARVLSAGMVSRVRYDNDAHHLTAVVESGFATGDNNPRDGVSRTFSMHSDHEVGLLLFEHVLPLLSANAVDRASDPQLVATPLPGARNAVNQGQVSNAVYLYPTLRWRPVPALDLRAGWLSAWSAGDAADPFLTGLAGGYAVGWGGGDASRRHLGDELDASARVHLKATGDLAVDLGAEGGIFLPGGALADLDLTPTTAPWRGGLRTLRARFDLRW